MAGCTRLFPSCCSAAGAGTDVDSSMLRLAVVARQVLSQSSQAALHPQTLPSMPLEPVHTSLTHGYHKLCKLSNSSPGHS